MYLSSVVPVRRYPAFQEGKSVQVFTLERFGSFLSGLQLKDKRNEQFDDNGPLPDSILPSKRNVPSEKFSSVSSPILRLFQRHITQY